MYACNECGEKDFVKYEGFMYCSQCQSQAEFYHEEEHDFDPMATKALGKPKKVVDKSTKDKLSVADKWTSWDAFNHILYGMVQELKATKLVEDSIETIVLELWACVLQRSQVAFVSRLKERLPRLGFSHRARDRKVLYGVDYIIPKKKRKRRKSGSITSGSASLSLVSTPTQKKLKKNLLEKDYEAFSLSFKSDTLVNETIESLGRSSCPESDAESEKKPRVCLREVLSSEDFDHYKKYKKGERSSSPGRYNKTLSSIMAHKISYYCKNKLLEIIHLALLLTGSELQLSDLLRFIREGHLAFAKVTHFLPEDVKLSKGDAQFIESVSDVYMPTHSKQRKIGRDIIKSLAFNHYPAPNIELLISRYCRELNLPDKIGQYSIRICKRLDFNKICKLSHRKYIPNYEGLAAATIIFILKLFFSLDGKTELVLSDLAQRINTSHSSSEKKLFVFSDWQAYIECRKTLISDYHYPTEEKLSRFSTDRTNSFMNMLIKENKDNHRDGRFKSYPQYYMDSKTANDVEETLNAFIEPKKYRTLDFPPSLTPFISYLDIILRAYSNKKMNTEEFIPNFPEIEAKALTILNAKFTECDVDFVLYPDGYLHKMEEDGFEIIKKRKSDLEEMTFVFDESKSGCPGGVRINYNDSSTSRKIVWIDNLFDYWILKPTRENRNFLQDFKNNVIKKTSKNFQWLISEISMMLEMNSRELYEELRFVEKNFVWKYA